MANGAAPTFTHVCMPVRESQDYGVARKSSTTLAA